MSYKNLQLELQEKCLNYMVDYPNDELIAKWCELVEKSLIQKMASLKKNKNMIMSSNRLLF